MKLLAMHIIECRPSTELVRTVSLHPETLKWRPRKTKAYFSVKGVEIGCKSVSRCVFIFAPLLHPSSKGFAGHCLSSAVDGKHS